MKNEKGKIAVCYATVASATSAKRLKLPSFISRAQVIHDDEETAPMLIVYFAPEDEEKVDNWIAYREQLRKAMDKQNSKRGGLRRKPWQDTELG